LFRFIVVAATVVVVSVAATVVSVNDSSSNDIGK